MQITVTVVLCYPVNVGRLEDFPFNRFSDENTCGMSALLQRKTMSAPLYPQIGHVFANLPPNSAAASTSAIGAVKEGEGGGGGSGDKDSLLINVIEEGNQMLENLRILNLKPQVHLA